MWETSVSDAYQVTAASILQHPRISIIINTDGRAKSLEATLNSLQQLDYPNFEVCVVYGPTDDGTKEVAEGWSDRLKIAHCPSRNLSRSRNIGLALSSGEIVAFLDDDAIPEPEWLDQVIAPFRDSKVDVSGGFLLDHTGVTFQWRYGTADRLGRADLTWNKPTPEFNFPLSNSYPHVIGANSVFRRSKLIEVGGFDENFAYYLDETDVILRILDAGGHIAQVEGARVHHKFRPSHIRSESKVLTSWYAVFYSKIYFCLIHSQKHHSMGEIISEVTDFINKFKRDLSWAVDAQLLDPGYIKIFEEETDRAWRDGLKNGSMGNCLFIADDVLSRYSSSFMPFRTILPLHSKRVICLLSQSYPPQLVGGVGRYIHQLAKIMAKLGHKVHVLTRAEDHPTVDLEDGVWVRRIPSSHHQPHSLPHPVYIPQRIWNYSKSACEELEKIAALRSVDIVYAPIWDCEGIAALLSNRFEVVTSLQTTLKFWLDSHPHIAADREFIEGFAEPMIGLERKLFQQSAGIHAISAAIAREIEGAYAVDFGSTHMAVVPLGQEDWSVLPANPPDPWPVEGIRLLFVGRLEERKGIDVLLRALPTLLTDHPDLYVDIVGNDSLLNEHESTYRADFEKAHADAAFISRVLFHGEVEEQRLRGLYKACDIFTAPSRFESFGLILLEAMMFSKPVIACRAGGMVEVVDEGVSGLLAEPGDPTSLASAIGALIADAGLRERMGRAGRERYEACFTPERMAKDVMTFLTEVSDRAKSRRQKV